MAEFNRRETQRAKIVQIYDRTNNEQFAEKNKHELRELVNLLKQAYEKYTDQHILIVETVTDAAGLKVQTDASAAITEIYISAIGKIQARISELQAEFLNKPWNRLVLEQNKHEMQMLIETEITMAMAQATVATMNKSRLEPIIK